MSPTSTGSGWLLALRWSVRDLRARWLQVAAIALVIALGTGSYAGLSNVTRWRDVSTNLGYETLTMYDLRVRLSEGTTLPEGALLAAVAALPGLRTAEERLIVDVQVDASTDDSTILVPGTVYGLAVGSGLPAVNGLSVPVGRPLTEGDRGEPVVLMEHHFARHYGLPASGTVRISGGQTLQYVGQALTPEFFIVTTERGGLLAEASFAAIFTSLATAQDVTGRDAAVNDMVLTLNEGTDRESSAGVLATLLSERLPGVGTTVMTRDDDPSFRLNTSDIKGDQQIYDIFALLMFTGAVVAAFNLVARVVESQRREIGLSMALGVAPIRIALRPMLVAAQIASLGVIFGVAVGMLIGLAMLSVLRDLQPLPEWRTPFLLSVFLAVGAAGFLLPFLATLWPVWRAVRVQPMAALRAAYRAPARSGLAPLLSRIPMPGDTFSRVPVRNVVRSPRRSILTGIGIAAALAALLAFVGLIDSFLATIDRGREEVLSSSPSRLDVTLERPFPVAGPEVSSLRSAAAVEDSVALVRVESLVSRGDRDVDLQLELRPLDSSVWAPTITSGQLDRAQVGIYLSELAARNLDVQVGDFVRLRHPRLNPDGSFELIETQLPVLGLHPHPFRFIAYVDINHAGMLNLTGLTNLLQVVPADGVTPDDVKRALFEEPGVVSVQGVGEVADALEDLLGEFVVLLRIVEFAMVLLALLIAFNSASINVDERAREHATMFAFGVPIRTVMRMAIVENLVLGVAATVVGVGVGWLLLRAIIAVRIPSTLPDVAVTPVISATSLLLTVILGVLAVGFAPLLTLRRLRRTDVPATLKVFE